MPSSLSAPSVPTSRTFSSFDLCGELERAIAAVGYTEPRPIQAQTIPAVLDGRDVLGLAQTGTGKTAAFALPILDRLLSDRGPGPRVLVVAPTRELAKQIDSDFHSLAQFTNIRTVTVYGGVSDRRQIRDLARRPQIVVACPGRLLDLHRQGAVRLDTIETLVLDEADHMFDMGFLPDLRRILAVLPEDRQNLLFSATMPREIRGLAHEILHDPVTVELAHSKPAKTIEHALYPVAERRKRELLEHLIESERVVSALVFTRTKHRARKLARDLDKAGYRAVALQGNMSQNARDRAMGGFRDGRFDILVATDIVARGIDVEQISHVFNFDVPGTPEAYTHRIGRTGRAERSGKAYTFVTGEDRAIVRAVERQLDAAIPRCRVDGFEDVETSTDDRPARRPGSRGRQGGRGGGGGGGRGGGRGRQRGGSRGAPKAQRAPSADGGRSRRRKSDSESSSSSREEASRRRPRRRSNEESGEGRSARGDGARPSKPSRPSRTRRDAERRQRDNGTTTGSSERGASRKRSRADSNEGRDGQSGGSERSRRGRRGPRRRD